MTQEKVITFDQAAERLVDNGYLPIPVTEKSKAPAISEWTQYRFKEEDAKKHIGCGIGILPGQGDIPLSAIDCDTTNPELLKLLHAELEKISAGAPLLARVGRYPRVLFLFRAETAFSKMTSKKFVDEEGEEHQLEILGDGQHFVAYGIHDKTLKPYKWLDDRDPLNTKADQLGIITLEQAQKLSQLVNDFGAAKGWPLAAKKPAITNGLQQRQITTTEPLTVFDVDCMRCKDIPIAKARQILSYIDNNDYEQWREVGMALHLEYEASEEALELWNEWSMNSSRYPVGGLEELRKKWESFYEVGKLRNALVGMPTLIAKSEEARASIDMQMRMAARNEFLAALEKCSSDLYVEALVRKTSLSNSLDKEVYASFVVKKLADLGVKTSKKIIQTWFKKSSCTDYEMSELGLAERMRDTYKGGLKWDCVGTQGYVWSGSRWTKLYPEMMMCYARKTVEALRKEADSLEDKEKGAELRAFAKQCSKPWVWEQMIKAFKSFAEGDASVIIQSQMLNQNLRYFGVENGEIDLETGKFIKGDPSHLITRHSPVAYDPEADCPYTRTKILEMCSGDREKADLVWMLFALAMTGRARRLFPIIYGIGHNGKSALLSIFVKIFGNGETGYHVGIDKKTFLKGKEGSAGSAREDIVRIKDMRLAVLMESDEGARLDSATVKQLTGGDSFTARAQYARHSISFVPCCLPMLITNHRPIIDDQSEGIWDRLLPIHFCEEFGQDKADPNFDRKTEEELPGILNELIKYVLRLKKEGLKIPECVKRDQAKYRAASDPLGEFFEEFCVIDPHVSEVRSELYREWKSYAQDARMQPFQERKSWFFGRLEERGFLTFRTTADGIRVRGICLKRRMEFESLEDKIV